MSGKRAKSQRRAQAKNSVFLGNAEMMRSRADSLLSIGFEDIELTRLNQIVLGLFRAAFAQSKVIGEMALQGMYSATGPNRRLFAEIAIRLHWLWHIDVKDRPGVVDAMLDDSKENTTRTYEHVKEEDWGSYVDLDDMDSFPLRPAQGVLKDQARKFAAAALAGGAKNVPLYAMWREESNLAHASAPLAGAYAPAVNDSILGRGTPDSFDEELEAHQLIAMLIMSSVLGILKEEGTSQEIIDRITEMFFSC